MSVLSRETPTIGFGRYKRLAHLMNGYGLGMKALCDEYRLQVDLCRRLALQIGSQLPIDIITSHDAARDGSHKANDSCFRSIAVSLINFD